MIIYQDFELSNILWYQVGGKARYLLEVEKEEDIEPALDFVEEQHIQKVFVCGLGSNLIFSDDYFDGAVIRIATDKNSSESILMRTDGTIEVFAGTILFSGKAMEKGLLGFANTNDLFTNRHASLLGHWV